MAIGPLYRPMIEVARELGVDVDAVLAQQNLSAESLVASETRLRPDQGRALGAAVVRALPAGVDRCEFGLRSAERFVASDADLLGYIMSHSASPLEAARALIQHARLIGDSADFRLEITDTRVTLTLGLIGGRQLTPEGADFAAAVIFRMLRDLSQGSARPIAVELPRDKPRRASMYQRFFGVPVSFGAPMPKLEYESACMHAPFSQQDRRLVELLSQHAAALVKNIVPPASDAWQERVRAVIADGLVRGDCALDRVAWRCGVGERTLRRRLADAGTSYRALVDDVRKERALEWLDGPGSVTVVAQRLGFSDATAFARAFRRWTGVPPHEHVHRTRSS